ncbi:hypothetical protein AB0N04_38545, partial [Kitasatospora sp. NPDC051702]
VAPVAAEAPAEGLPETEGPAEGLPETEAPAEGLPEAVGAAEAGAPEGSMCAVEVGAGVPVAAVAIPPAVAMTAAVTTAAVAAIGTIGRMRMNPCPFLRASG